MSAKQIGLVWLDRADRRTTSNVNCAEKISLSSENAPGTHTHWRVYAKLRQKCISAKVRH